MITGTFLLMTTSSGPSTHDARVLVNSDNYRQGKNGTLFGNRTSEVKVNEIPVILLEDVAYPMRQWLQKPFMDRTNLTK